LLQADGTLVPPHFLQWKTLSTLNQFFIPQISFKESLWRYGCVWVEIDVPSYHH
jgi:hypothetical protein